MDTFIQIKNGGIRIRVRGERDSMYTSVTLKEYLKGGVVRNTWVWNTKKRFDQMIEPFVEIVGVEPTTPCLQSRCSSQLSYTPRIFKNFVVPSRLELLTPTLSV